MIRFAALGLALALAACAAAPVAVTSAPRALPTKPPVEMQYLYGSGEAVAGSIQAYHAMRDYVLGVARARPASSVVLANGSALDAPRFEACGDKPLAVVLDIDETVLLNLGFEYDLAASGRPYDQLSWERWEREGVDKVAPVPGAVTALRAIREAGVNVVFNTNRKAANAAFTEAAVNKAGLGPARYGDTLIMQGDLGSDSAKDTRRALISSRFCVIAMAGDQLGDFSDLFNAKALSPPQRRDLVGSGVFAQKWGAGWFMLPNPVYGSAIKGGFDDVFPTDKRWTDPVAKEPK